MEKRELIELYEKYRELIKQGVTPTRDNIAKYLNLSDRMAGQIMFLFKNAGEYIDIALSENNGKRIKIGIIGDTHIGSKAQKVAELRTYYEYARREGVSAVFHTGDILDGIGVYPGQEFEVITPSIDEQIKILKNEYPDDITTYFILGNHDYRIWQKTGIDIGKMIEAEKSKMIYLGITRAHISLGGIKIELWHGSGGGAYSLSYKLQKYIESYVPGEKPRFLFVGHYHTSAYLPIYRNVDAFLSSCFQGETLYTKRKGIHPTTGGWILDIELTDKKEVVYTKAGFVPFYSKDIQYKNIKEIEL